MAYSTDLRERVLALYDEGLKTAKVAEQLRVSRSWARRVKQRRDQPPKVNGGSVAKLDETARRRLAQWIEQQPDATLEQLRRKVASQLHVQVSIGTLWNTLRRMKFTFKKSRSKPASNFGPTCCSSERSFSSRSRVSR